MATEEPVPTTVATTEEPVPTTVATTEAPVPTTVATTEAPVPSTTEASSGPTMKMVHIKSVIYDETWEEEFYIDLYEWVAVGENGVLKFDADATIVRLTETPVPTAAGSMVPSTELQDVTFTVGRSAAFSNVITFVKESGSGPDSISFGPNSGTVTVSMGADAIYNLESTTVDGAPGGWFRLSGGQLQFEDTGDGDYNDLTVTPNSGQFTSSTRYQLALL